MSGGNLDDLRIGDILCENVSILTLNRKYKIIPIKDVKNYFMKRTKIKDTCFQTSRVRMHDT